MKWYLMWFIVSMGADGELETKHYETSMTSRTACYEAQMELDEKLMAEGHEQFTTSCEVRFDY